MSLRIVATVALAASLTGCAGMSEQACLTSDWRTVGFEDGTRGRSEGTIGRYRQQCAEHGVAPDLVAYREGHAEGVQVYCRAANGFTVGHSGAVYQGVCPADLEPAFIAEYNSGRRLYELESAVARVNARLASNRNEQQRIRDELTAIGASMISDETTKEQRLLLVSRTAELGRRYGELGNEIEALERERALHELSLRDYQQTLTARY